MFLKKDYLKLSKKNVIFSVNNEEGNLCIDLFVRKNKTFGFEEYRKDPENIMGWYKIGNYSGKIFDTKEEAYKNACIKIKWLKKRNEDC